MDLLAGIFVEAANLKNIGEIVLEYECWSPKYKYL